MITPAKKLDLATLFQAGNFWRGGKGHKLSLGSKANVIEFLQNLLSLP